MKLKKTFAVISYLNKHGIKCTVGPTWLEVSPEVVASVGMFVFDRLMMWQYVPPKIVAPKVKQKTGPKPKPKVEVKKEKKQKQPKKMPYVPVVEKWKLNPRCQAQQFREVMANVEVEFISFEQMQRNIKAQKKAEKQSRPVGRPKNPNKVSVPPNKRYKPKKQGTFDPNKLSKFAQETVKPAPFQRPPAVYSNPNWSSMYQ